MDLEGTIQDSLEATDHDRAHRVARIGVGVGKAKTYTHEIEFQHIVDTGSDMVFQVFVGIQITFWALTVALLLVQVINEPVLQVRDIFIIFHEKVVHRDPALHVNVHVPHVGDDAGVRLFARIVHARSIKGPTQTDANVVLLDGIVPLVLLQFPVAFVQGTSHIAKHKVGISFAGQDVLAG